MNRKAKGTSKGPKVYGGLKSTHSTKCAGAMKPGAKKGK